MAEIVGTDSDSLFTVTRIDGADSFESEPVESSLDGNGSEANGSTESPEITTLPVFEDDVLPTPPTSEPSETAEQVARQHRGSEFIGIALMGVALLILFS